MAGSLKAQAIRLLARREYPRADLEQRLIAKGAERNVFACAVIGDVARLKKLLQRDPSLVHATTATDVRSYQHFTPLHACAMSALGRESEATSRQLAQVARLLIDRGGDVNAVGLFYRGYSVTPLDVAAHTGGNIALVEILLNRGATISAFAFGEALAHRGRTLDEGLALATRFLQHGFDVHAPYKNATLLHNSANTGGAEVVEWLLANGADVNARDATGRTPLHAAAERNRSPRVIQILRAHGAKPHLTDSRGQIPLDIARQFDRSALLAWLRP